MKTFFAVVVVAAVGCGPGPSMPGPSAFTLQAEGTGEANEAPLWPLTVGQSFTGLLSSYGGPERGFVVQEPIQLGPWRAWPFASTEGYTYGDGFSPEQPGKVQYLARGDDGALLDVGDARRGPASVAAVWLPPTVRDGMRWATGLDERGAPRFVITVVGHALEDTVVGRRRVWRLDVYDRDAFDADQANEVIVRGATHVWRYAEGVGPITRESRHFERVVSPIDDAPAAPEVPARVKAEPLNGGLPVLERFLPQTVMSVERPGQPSDLGLIGFSGSIGAADFMGGVSVGVGLAVACVTATGGPADEDRCLNALGTVPFADGGVAQLPASGLFDDRTYSCARKGNAPGCWSYDFNALWRGADGGTNVASVGGDIFLRGVFSARPSNPSHGVGEGLFELRPPLMPLAPRFERWLLWTGAAAEGDVFVVPQPPAYHWVSVEQGEAQTRPGPLLSGAWGFRSGLDGRELLVTRHDGRVEQLRPTSSGLRRAHVVDVELPAGHSALGAVRQGDGLVIVSGKGFRGRDAQFAPGYWDQTIKPELGDAYLWRVPAAEPGPARTPKPLESLIAWASGVDLALCWHGDDGAVPEGPWTLGGEPAVVLHRPEVPCALVLRTQAPQTLDTSPSYFTVEGRFSGSERFVFGVTVAGAKEAARDRDVLLSPAMPVAPLVGGGFISNLEFAPGMVASRMHQADARSCVPDLGGQGLWCGQTLLSRGRRSVWPFAGRPVVQGGGLLSGSQVARPDGGVEQVNLAGAGATFEVEALLSNGVVVGRLRGEASAAGLRDGAQLWKTTLGVQSLHAVGRAVWGVNVATVLPTLGLARLDSVTGASQVWSWGELLASPWPAATVRYATSPSGRLFALVTEDRTVQWSHTLFELTEAAPERVEFPALQGLSHVAELAFAVDDKAIVAWWVPGQGETFAPGHVVRQPLAAQR